MASLRPFPLSISLSPLLLCMGVTGFTQAAGMPGDAPSLGSAEAQSLRVQAAEVTDRIIVKYRHPAVANSAIAAVSRQVSHTTGHVMTHMGGTGSGAQIYKLEENLPLEDVQRITHEIETNPAVEYAEPDKRFFPLYTPTDPRYSEQWHYYETTAGVRLPEAWDSTMGEDVLIAVVDTGYTDHADLVGNLQLPGIDLIDDTNISNDGDGRDQDAHDPGDWSPNCGWDESSWHGTHTAGTIAASGDNGIGVTGVAFNARVLPVRVLGTCGGWLSDVADGIVWAAGGSLNGVPDNQTPVQVINVSIGSDSTGCSQYMQDAIDTALQRNTTVVVASGNNSRDVSGTEPANCSGVITVAASDRNGNRAAISNYGDMVDIAAPGVLVLSTANTGTTTPENDNYEYYLGTSMATSHVSGVAALLYALRPDITPGELEQILKDTARPFPGSCSGCGAGLLDAAAAVFTVNNPIPSPVPNPNPEPQPNIIILENGVAENGLSGLSDDRLMFVIDLPANANNLNFTINGGSGDADLYVHFGAEPTLSRYDCRPYLHGNVEQCDIPNPQEGRFYVLLHGYDTFSGVSLLVTYDEGSIPNPDPTNNHFENTVDYQIPSYNFAGVDSPMDVPLSGMSGTVVAHVEIIHPAMREVLVRLIAPNGRSFILSFGTERINLNETYILNLDDIPATGIWTLHVKDFGLTGQGFIDRWSLTFE